MEIESTDKIPIRILFEKIQESILRFHEVFVKF